MRSLQVLGIVFVIVGIIGAYQYPHQQSFSGTSVSGSTFLTSKSAAVAVNLGSVGSTGTSTSILNTDANDRLVTGVRIGCEAVGTSKTAYSGTGLAALQVSVATTTAAAPATLAYNFALALNLTVATATPNYVMASTTNVIATSTAATVWPTNTYMTFSWNATNTAVCTEAVDYLGS